VHDDEGQNDENPPDDNNEAQSNDDEEQKDDDDDEEQIDGNDDENPLADDNVDTAGVHDDENVNDHMDAKYGPRTGSYNLRARKPRDYSHIHTTLESTVMTQHGIRKGLQLFGKAGVDTVLKELTQLHERGV